VINESFEDWAVIRRATNEDLEFLKPFIKNNTVFKAWVINNKSTKKNSVIINFEKRGTLVYDLYFYTEGSFIGHLNWDDYLGKAIKDFEFKQSLNKDTVTTLEDLINDL